MEAESGCTVVVVAYKPEPGKEADLLQLTREHVPLFRAEGLATRAHSNSAVLKLWERYGAACDIVPLVSLAETSNMFASFTPLEL